jgi:hypothetical protein
VKLLAWALALGLMVFAMMEYLLFFEATACRQKAWLKGAELQTRTLLHSMKSREVAFDKGCKLKIERHYSIYWQRFPNSIRNHFYLPLRGKL